MSIPEPIVPDPNWGLPSPNIDPDEWIDDDDDYEFDKLNHLPQRRKKIARAIHRSIMRTDRSRGFLSRKGRERKRDRRSKADL